MTDRNADLVRERRAGATYAELAKRFGISVSRANQIYERWRFRHDMAEGRDLGLENWPVGSWWHLALQPRRGGRPLDMGAPRGVWLEGLE